MGEQRGRAGAAAEELCGFGVDSSEAQRVEIREGKTDGRNEGMLRQGIGQAAGTGKDGDAASSAKSH